MAKSKTTIWMKIAVVLLVILVAFNGFIITEKILNRPWTPLCDYPVQEVTNSKIDGIAHVKVGETVNVNAQKCNTTEFAIKVRGVRTWQSLSPLGTYIVEEISFGERQPGVQRIEYRNEIPPTVIVRSRNVKLETGKDAIWVITGTETPFKDDGTEGVEKVWVTEKFIIDV